MTRPAKHRESDHGVMSLGDHLDELRSRIGKALLGLLPLVIVCAYFGDRILSFMIAPVRQALKSEGQDFRLRTFGPLESFTAYFYVACMTALILGAPWVLYQLWKFVSPGLYLHERRFAYLLAPMSFVLSIVGFCVMRFLMMPVAMAFLVHFGVGLMSVPEGVVEAPAGVVFPLCPVLDGDPPKPTVGQEWFNRELRERRMCIGVSESGAPEILGVAYTKSAVIQQDFNLKQCVDLFVQLALIFVLAFQLPLVMLLLSWAGIINATMMAKYRKYAFAGAVVGSALISPTGDPLSLAMLQVPLYLLYELGILMMRILPAGRVAGPVPKDEDDADDEEAGGPATGP